MRIPISSLQSFSSFLPILFRNLAVIVVVPLLLTAPVWGATYYVDYNNGSNANSGSSASPWKECPGTQNPSGSTSGWRTIAAGDTVIFTGGQTWNRPIYVSSSWFANPSNESGRITLRSSSDTNKAIINLSGQSQTYGIRISRNYITVRGFEIENVSGNSYIWGIIIYNDYDKVLYSTVHNIIDTGSNRGYGICLQTGTNAEIAYNIVYNTDTKGITQDVAASYADVHHNYVYVTSDWSGDTMDHLIVMNGPHNMIHENIVYAGQSLNGFGIKVDGDDATYQSCQYEYIYNNLVYHVGMGIGAMDCVGPTVIANNTIYQANAESAGSASSSGVNGIDIGVNGGGTANKTTVENNLIYYVGIGSGYSHQIYINSSNQNTIIRNNLFYRDGSSERFRVGGASGLTMSYMENTWSGSNGNLFQNNVIANPHLAGGTYPLSNIPNGFDSNGHPNADGLSIESSSNAIDAGYNLSSLFTDDIIGTTRSGTWDIGAYEFTGAGASQLVPNPPTLLSIN